MAVLKKGVSVDGIDSLMVYCLLPVARLRMRGSRLGTCFLEVVQYIPLPSPQPAIHKGAAERPNTEVSSLTDQCVQRLLDQGNMADENRDGLILHLGESPPEDFPCKSAFQVPIGLGQLFYVQRWSTLAVSPTSKWDRDSDIFDLLSRVRKCSKNIENCSAAVAFVAEAAGSSPVAPNTYALLAQDLMSWSSSICASTDNPQETRDLIHRYVLDLNTAHESHSSEAFASYAWELGGAKHGKFYNQQLQAFGQYRAAFLLECVMFSFNLRRSGLLKKALIRAVRVLPPFWSSTLEDMLKGGCLPSEATISRARLFLDVAFMLHWQQVWKNQMLAGATLDSKSGPGECKCPGVLYLLADSSPQGQQNWFMVEVFGIHAEALPRAAELFEELYALQFRDGVGADELEIFRGWVEELRSAIFHHTLVPTGLGPRHATLAHKTQALLHSIRLESENWSQVQDFLSSVATITSDQGVEVGLNLASASCRISFHTGCNLAFA